MTIDQVGDILLRNESYKKLLSLPVVVESIPLGIISRYQIKTAPDLEQRTGDLFDQSRKLKPLE